MSKIDPSPTTHKKYEARTECTSTQICPLKTLKQGFMTKYLEAMIRK